MKIKIPATSANLGPGFDSCGIALSQYLIIDVLDESDEWNIEHTLGPEVPKDKTNLLIKTALKIAPKLLPKKLKMISEIPLARGLGSSSTAIVAGIELANQLGTLNLSQTEKVQLATEIEGHPDNVAPAICGDFVIASYINDQVYYVKHHFPECDVIAFVPEHQLLTSESRSVLPSSLVYKEAVQASSIANVMIAAILQENLSLAGQMMEKDLWHEIYRDRLVPHLEDIRLIAHQTGAYGAFLSGAGPTVLVLTPKDKTSMMVAKLEKLPVNASVHVLKIDTKGIQVEK